MNNDWIEFHEGPVVQDPTRMHVSITPPGLFYLNSAALKALGEPDAVVLFYDKRLQRIGIKRASIATRNAYVLKRKDKAGARGRNLYAANFCRHFRIKPSETLIFVTPEMDGELLVLSLHDVVGAGGGAS